MSDFAWRKVVSAKDMAEVEQCAISAGDSGGDVTGEAYMLRAAAGIADYITQVVHRRECSPIITILVGKGNNGGDGYTVAEILHKGGYQVDVYQFFALEECSPLCRQHAEQFTQSGGKIFPVRHIEELLAPTRGLVLDALLGTGFKGRVTGFLAEVISLVNCWNVPKISIDIASGISGDDGNTEGPAIYADETVALGSYKIGHFVAPGFLHTGQCTLVDFGMSSIFHDTLPSFGYIIPRDLFTRHFPKRQRTDHKYTIGQVLVCGGSPGMGGAALLSATAALRTGAGIVKLFHPSHMTSELSSAAHELIKISWVPDQLEHLYQELTRTKSIVLGPGMGRSDTTKYFLQQTLEKVSVPTVLDADALYFFDDLPRSSIPLILTPHEGELRHLLRDNDTSSPFAMLKKAQAFVDQHQITLVYKGAPTYVLHPDMPVLIVPYGNPGMATAGSGDVLAGIIGALCARISSPREAATMGVLLHQLAGEQAAKDLSEEFLCASDLIHSLHKCFTSLRSI